MSIKLDASNLIRGTETKQSNQQTGKIVLDATKMMRGDDGSAVMTTASKHYNGGAQQSDMMVSSIDANSDGEFNIMDLIRAKKVVASSPDALKSYNQSAEQVIRDNLRREAQKSAALQNLNKAAAEYIKAKKENNTTIVEKALDFLGGKPNQTSDEINSQKRLLEAAKVYGTLGGDMSEEEIKRRLNYLNGRLRYLNDSHAVAQEPKNVKYPEYANLSADEVEQQKVILNALKGNIVDRDDVSNYINSNIEAGAVSIATGLSATSELLFLSPIKGVIQLFGGDPNVISAKSARKSLDEKYQGKASEAALSVGDTSNIGGQLIQNVVGNIPNMVMAVATGGGSLAPTLGQTAKTFASTISALAKNPMIYYTFAETFGKSFEDAQDILKEKHKDGNLPIYTDALAVSYAFIESAINAYIEVGGGIETLPGDLKAAVSSGQRLLDWLISSLEEGGEEMLQGTVTEILQRLMLTQKLPTIEELGDFSKQMMFEAGMGVAGGAILGGGNLTFNAIVNAKSTAQYNAIGESVLAHYDIDPIIDYAMKSDSEYIRSLANNVTKSKTDTLAIGQLYSYICRDVQSVFSGTDANIITSNFVATVKDVGADNSIVKSVLLPRYIETMQELGASGSEIEGTVLEVLTMAAPAESSVDNVPTENGEATSVNKAAPLTPENESRTTLFTEPSTRDISEDWTAEDNLNAAIGNSKSNAQKHIERVAGQLGDYTIRWDTAIERGTYNPKSNTITLNPNMSVAELYAEVFKHEFMHSMETRKLYNSFKGYLFKDSVAFEDYVRRQLEVINGKKFDGSRADALSAYTDWKYNQYTSDTGLPKYLRDTFDRTSAEREIVADFVGEELLGGSDFEASMQAMTELAQKDRNLFQRIMDCIREFINKLRGRPQNASIVNDLEYLENRLAQVYDSANKKKAPANSSGLRYSIASDSDGYYVKVDINQDIFDNKTATEIQGLAKSIILENFKGKVLQVGDNGKAYVNKRSAEEYAYPANRRIDDQIKISKMRAAPELDNLLAVSQFIEHSSDNNGRHPDATGGWDKYLTRFEIGGEQFQGEVQIKVTDRGYVFYDITKVKRITRIVGQTDNKSAAASGNPSDNSISQSNSTVNNQSMQKNEEYSIAAEKSGKLLDNETYSLGSPTQQLRYNPERYAEYLKRRYHSDIDVEALTNDLTALIKADNAYKHAEVEELANKISRYIAEGVPTSATSEIDADTEADADYITRQMVDGIKEHILSTMNSTGKRAENRRVNEARREGFAKGKKLLEDYKRKESAKKNEAAITERKRTLRDKTGKLLKSFERRLTKPNEGSHIPPNMVRAAIEALKIVQDTPIMRDGEAISSKYYADLEALSQRIAMAEDEVTKNALIEQYDKKFNRASEAAEKLSNLNSAYTKFLKSPNIDKNSGVYTDVKFMLDNLYGVVENTPPHLYDEHQLEAVYNTFAALDRMVTNENKMVASKIKKSVFETARSFIGEIGRSQGRVLDGKFGVDSYLTMMTDPMRFFRRLGNFENNSMAEQLANMFNEGSHAMMRYKMDANEIFRDVLIGSKENFKQAQALQSIKEKDLVDSGLIDENGKSIKITKAMRLSLVMHSFNEQNMRHFEYGIMVPDIVKYYNEGANTASDYATRGYINSQTWQSDLISALSEYETQWIRAMQEYYNGFSAKHINEVTITLYGFEKAVEDNYYRIVTSKQFTNRTTEGISYDASLENAGWLKERVNAQNPIYLTDALMQVQSDIDSHAQFYGMAIPMHNFNKVYNFTSAEYNTSVKNAISKKFPVTGNRYIEKLLTDLNGAARKSHSFFDTLKGRYAQAVLMFNLSVSLKQAASYPTAAAELGWKPLMKALAVVEKDNGSKGFVFSRAEVNLIKKYSPLLWYRMQGNIDSELGDINRYGLSAGDKLSKSMPALFNWIQKIDGATVGRLWYASKYYVDDNFSSLKKGTDAYYQKVAEVFNNVVEKTQPNYTTMQRPDILRSDNAFWRGVTMFATQRLQNVNIVMDSVMNLQAKSRAYKLQDNEQTRAELKAAKRGVARAISSQAVAAVVLSSMTLFANALLNNMGRYRDDNDEITAKSIMSAFGLDVLDTLIGSPLFGSEVYEAINAAFRHGKWYGVNVPSVEMINDTVSSFVSAFNTISDVQELIDNGAGIGEIAMVLGQNIISLSETVAMLFGIPAANIEKTLLGAYYSIADIVTGKAFETAVKEGTVNELFKKSTRSKKQYYAIMSEAAEDGDMDKFQRIYEQLTDKGLDADQIRSGLRDYFKEKEGVVSQSKSYKAELSQNKTYQSLTNDDQKDLNNKIKSVLAAEEMLKALDSYDDFDRLYAAKRKNQAEYEKLKAKLKGQGMTDSQIKEGEEIAKVAYMKSVGVDVHEYLLMKKATSKTYADTDGSGGVDTTEKENAINAMDVDEKVKNALLKIQ